MSVEIILALGVVAFCVASGVGLWLLKNLVNAVESTGAEIRGMEATHNSVREGLEQGLGQLVDAVRAHTSTVRDTAAQAPEAVAEQRDRLLADNEKLVGALERILAFTPDPDTGTYQAGVQDALSYAQEQMRLVLA